MFNWSSGDKEVLPRALIIIIVCALAIAILLRKHERLKKLPLKLLALLIVGLETAKQIYYNTYEPFTLYILPLHFCSTFIWLIPLAQFTRGKFNKFVKPMPFCYSIVVTALIYAYPRVLLGNSTADVFGSFHNTHTIMFHHVMVAYFVFSLASGDYKPSKFDFAPLITGILFYAAYAVPASYLLGVNYVNILRSDFPPLENLRLVAGQTVYDIVLCLVAIAAVLMIWLACFGASKLFSASQKPPTSQLE